MQPKNKHVIKRVVMLGNGSSLPPKTLSEAQSQFEAVLRELKVPINERSDPKKVLSRLRSLPVDKLVLTTAKLLTLHQFRAVADNDFVHPELFKTILDGRFAALLKENNVQMLLVETSQDRFVYAENRPPLSPGRFTLTRRFDSDYPHWVATALVDSAARAGMLPGPGKGNGLEEWRVAFGKVYASAQIYASQRGLADAMARHGAGDLVKRCRIEWRSESLDPYWFPVEWGATHGSDAAIWFYGNGNRLSEKEGKVAMQLLTGFTTYLKNGELGDGWGDGPRKMKRLTKSGKVEEFEDIYWEENMAIWRDIAAAQSSLEQAKL
jgi:hypothetical protein